MLTVATVLWLGMAVLSLAAVALLALTNGDLPCPAPSDHGDSNFGQAKWSWLPLGNECTFTTATNGFDDQDGPGWGLTIFFAGTVAGGIGVGYGHFRFLRPSRADSRSGEAHAPLETK